MQINYKSQLLLLDDPQVEQRCTVLTVEYIFLHFNGKHPESEIDSRVSHA